MKKNILAAMLIISVNMYGEFGKDMNFKQDTEGNVYGLIHDGESRLLLHQITTPDGKKSYTLVDQNVPVNDDLIGSVRNDKYSIYNYEKNLEQLEKDYIKFKAIEKNVKDLINDNKYSYILPHGLDQTNKIGKANKMDDANLYLLKNKDLAKARLDVAKAEKERDEAEEKNKNSEIKEHEYQRAINILFELEQAKIRKNLEHLQDAGAIKGFKINEKIITDNKTGIDAKTSTYEISVFE